jgi:integrase
VEPRWGRTQVAAIRPTAVESWVAELTAKLSPSRVRVIHLVLADILGDALKDRLITANPARGIKLAKQARKANVYLTGDQLGALAEESGHYGALVLLLGTVGLRWGEAAALRVSDVDFLRRRITLHENAVAVSGTVHVGTLKTGRSRTVPVPAFVVDALSAACVEKSRGDLIWTARDGGYLAPPGVKSWLSSAVARCMAADEKFPRVTAHALRHTAASLAISAGANVKAVQRMLGHSSGAMTLDVYADLFDDDLFAVADRLDGLWANRGHGVVMAR